MTLWDDINDYRPGVARNEEGGRSLLQHGLYKSEQNISQRRDAVRIRPLLAVFSFVSRNPHYPEKVEAVLRREEYLQNVD